MLNIIVPYSPTAILIEIWSDWTKTHASYNVWPVAEKYMSIKISELYIYIYKIDF